MGKWKYIFSFLLLCLFAVLMAIFSLKDTKTLKIIGCDVGQGDAFLVTFQETQILIDGGPDLAVLDCLSSHISYWDRKIEAVILTHPQADHFTGLIKVLENYEVEILVANSLESSSQGYQVLQNIVGGRGIRVVKPESGTTIRLGLIYLDIVHPSESFFRTNTVEKATEGGEKVLGAFATKRDLNDFSVVAVLRLGEFEALFTGDIGPTVSNLVADTIAVDYQGKAFEYIKVPHHGSKNGLSNKLLETVNPQVAVISAGKNNRYGHPHKEILEMLKSIHSIILRTDEEGEVVVETDGKKWSIVGEK